MSLETDELRSAINASFGTDYSAKDLEALLSDFIKENSQLIEQNRNYLIRLAIKRIIYDKKDARNRKFYSNDPRNRHEAIDKIRDFLMLKKSQRDLFEENNINIADFKTMNDTDLVIEFNKYHAKITQLQQTTPRHLRMANNLASWIPEILGPKR